MTLPKKTLLLLGLAFTGLMGVLYTVSSTILWHNIRQAEQENARQAVAGVLSVFNQTQEEFTDRFADWSAWDDAYTFVKDGNQDFITSNLLPTALANLKVNLVLFIQPSGRIVYDTGFDRLHKIKESIPVGLQAHLSTQSPLLQHPHPKSSLTGILLLPEGPMLITSQPIVSSEGKGPIRGTLIFGRYLDFDEINKLSRSVRLPLRLHGLNQKEIPPDFQAARHSLSTQQTIVVRPLSEQTIAGYVLLPDIYGKPALQLRVDVPRELYKQGQNSQRYLIASLLVTALVFGIVILLLLQRLVLFLRQRQQAEAKYRSIFENAVEGIFQTTPEGQYLSANPALARIYGYESPELFIACLGNIKQQLYVEPHLRAKFVELMAKDGFVLGLEAQVYRQDRSVIWICENAHAIRDARGTLVYYEGTVEDITERKQSQEALIRMRVAERAKLELEQEVAQRQQVEAALRSSMETNQALLNAIPDLMLRLGRNGILVNFKAAKENSLPIVSSQLLGKHLDEVLPQEISQLVIDCVETALETKEVQVVEIQLPVDGKLLNYEVRLAVSATDEVMAIVRDITQRKQTEAEIRAALEREKELGELKSRFVAMTSHEFRTPLTTILSSSELLELYSHKWANEKKLNHLKRIQVAVKQMTGLLNDVLLIGKADAGKLEFNPTSLDLVKFCRDLVEEMEFASINHKIIFRTQAFCTSSQCVTACMDEKLLRHIFSNLLSNAIKYSPQGSTIDFSFVCQQGCAVFQIEDRGIGIPLADQDKLFDSFHRASNVGTISGTGLGLAIVKKSVDLHGGKIEVNSEVGVGTTITVTLPLNN